MALEDEHERAQREGAVQKPASTHLLHHERLLFEYLDGQISPGERESLEQHLGNCLQCQALSRDWQQLDSRLASDLNRPSLSPQFAARLWDRIEKDSTFQFQQAGADRRQTLEAEFAKNWAGYRRRFLRAQVLTVLDWTGYIMAAGIGTWLLVHFLLKAAGDANNFAAPLNSSWALGVSAGSALLFLLAISGFLGRRQVSRWLAQL